jgi:Fe-S-cluster containining protein
MARKSYNCKRCPAYCCSYPRIIVTKKDLERLARHFGISRTKARKRFTKKGDEPGERVLRHQKDDIYPSVCRFLDRESRRCTIYDGRPGICREYPGGKRCGYYDFLRFERRAQEDPEFIPTL